MEWIICLIAVSILGAILCFLIDNPNDAQNFKESLDNAKVPVVHIKIKDFYVPMMIDTGANVNMLHPDILEYIDDVDLTNAKSAVTMSANGTFTSKVIALNFELNKRKMKDNFVISDNVREISKSILEDTGVTILGLIGTETLKKGGFVIDFTNSTLKNKIIPKIKR